MACSLTVTSHLAISLKGNGRPEDQTLGELLAAAMYMRVPIVPSVATVHTARLVVELGREEEEALWHAVEDQPLEGNCDAAIGASILVYQIKPQPAATSRIGRGQLGILFLALVPNPGRGQVLKNLTRLWPGSSSTLTGDKWNRKSPNTQEIKVRPHSRGGAQGSEGAKVKSGGKERKRGWKP